MGNYFRGWKRKIGVVTLVLACLFAAGWVRSKSFQDEVRISLGYLPLFFNSCNGTLTWWQLQHLEPVPAYSFAFEWRTDPEVRGRTFGFSKYVTLEKGRSQPPTGVHISRAEARETGMLVNWTADYWAIVIPLTFLSVWLLLSKRRQPKATEPLPGPVA